MFMLALVRLDSNYITCLSKRAANPASTIIIFLGVVLYFPGRARDWKTMACIHFQDSSIRAVLLLKIFALDKRKSHKIPPKMICTSSQKMPCKHQRNPTHTFAGHEVVHVCNHWCQATHILSYHQRISTHVSRCVSYCHACFSCMRVHAAIYAVLCDMRIMRSVCGNQTRSQDIPRAKKNMENKEPKSKMMVICIDMLISRVMIFVTLSDSQTLKKHRHRNPISV